VSEVEWEKEYYEDDDGVSDTLCWEAQFLNHQQHGVEKWYHIDGTLRYEIFFDSGQRHGISKGYNKDGTLRETTLWIRGVIRNDLLGDKHRLERLMLLGEQVE